MSDMLTAALARLPHGPGFRFLDRLLSLEPGSQATGEFAVPAEADYLRAHFPGEPLLPGVLMIEAAAQLAGVLAQSDPTQPQLHSLKLSGVRGVKITGAARPGEILRLKATLLARLGGAVSAAVEASVNGAILLRGEVMLSGVVDAGSSGGAGAGTPP